VQRFDSLLHFARKIRLSAVHTPESFSKNTNIFIKSKIKLNSSTAALDIKTEDKKSRDTVDLNMVYSTLNIS
jgi:hypothetical protein